MYQEHPYFSESKIFFGSFHDMEEVKEKDDDVICLSDAWMIPFTGPIVVQHQMGMIVQWPQNDY
jgi:hypothetical protein